MSVKHQQQGNATPCEHQAKDWAANSLLLTKLNRPIYLFFEQAKQLEEKNAKLKELEEDSGRTHDEKQQVLEEVKLLSVVICFTYKVLGYAENTLSQFRQWTLFYDPSGVLSCTVNLTFRHWLSMYFGFILYHYYIILP